MSEAPAKRRYRRAAESVGENPPGSRLTVRAVEQAPGRLPVAVCDCSCGRAGFRTLLNKVRAGRTRSCGCLAAETLAARTTLGGLSRRAEYQVWYGMIRRCTDRDCKAYADYGGRGITVCPEWAASFTAFLRDVGPRPAPGMLLDRKDNERGYEPGNVRWVTMLVSNNNRRNVRRFTLGGVTDTLTGWARRLGRSIPGVSERIARLPLDIALTPKRPKETHEPQ